MTQVGQIYKCALCGNTVEIKAAGVGELVCCGQPMGLVPAKQEATVSEPIVSPTTTNEPEAASRPEPETESESPEEPPTTTE